MEYLNLQISLLTLSKIFSYGFRYIGYAILTRILTVEQIGIYGKVWLCYEIIEQFVKLGVEKSVFFFLPNLKKEHQTPFMLQTLSIIFILSASTFLLLFFFAPYLAEVFQCQEATSIIKIFSLYAFFSLPAYLISPYMVSTNKTVKYAVYYIIFETLFVFCVLIPAYITRELYYVFIGIVISGIIKVLILLIELFRDFSAQFLKTYRWNYLEQIKYFIPVGLSQIVGLLNTRIDKLCISILRQFSTSDFAYYDRGAVNLPFTYIFMSSVQTVIQPHLVRAKSSSKEFLSIWHKAIEKVGYILIPIFLFFFYEAKLFIIISYTKTFLKSTLPFRIYLLMIPLRLTAYSEVIMALGYPSYVLRGTFISFISNLFLNIILSFWIGFLGPAIATFLSIVIVVGYYLKSIANLLNIPLREVYPFKKILKIFIGGIISLVPIILLDKIFIVYSFYLLCLKFVVELIIFGIIYYYIFIFFLKDNKKKIDI